jgi:hypothetical protein
MSLKLIIKEMTKNWNKKSSWGLKLSLLMAVLFTMASCNKDFENKLDLSSKKDSLIGYKKPKVLYIIIDGARGSAVNLSRAPSVIEIDETAMQTYNGVSDPSGLPATTWADMLTGVSKAKHKVTQADFSGNNLASYPMFFKYLKNKNAGLRTAAFSSTPEFSQNLISSADVNQNFNNDDEAVKNAVVAELKEDKADVVLAEFNSVDRAGKSFGYDLSVPQYQYAIYLAFNHVDEILKTLKQRKNYEAENWLVIVASNQGGTYVVPPGEQDGSLYSNPLLNSFALLYNPRFAYQFYSKPNTGAQAYEGKSVGFTAGSIFGRIDVAKSDIYNFGTTGDYTVQLKVKIKNRGTNNPPIIAKSENTGNGTAGWSFLLTAANSSWRMQVAGVNVSGTALNLDTWYTLTGKLYMDGATRRLKVFTNGVLNGQLAITANATSTVAPLNIGASASAFGGGTAQTTITDVRIYNVALPDEYIASNFCKVELKSDDIYYNKLIGYWPGTDGISNKLVDMSPNKRDFILNGAYVWNDFSDLNPNLCVDLPADIYKRVPNGIDIPNFILSWMGINPLNLALDGKAWLPFYNDVNP